jgi:hypothetical protein
MKNTERVHSARCWKTDILSGGALREEDAGQNVPLPTADRMTALRMRHASSRRIAVRALATADGGRALAPHDLAVDGYRVDVTA